MALSLTLSRKTLLIIALAVVAIIVGLFMIFLLASNIRYLKDETEDEKAALNQSEIRLIQSLDYQRNAPLYQEKYDRLKFMIPLNPEEEEILRYFSYLAEEYGLTVSEIRFGDRLPYEEEGYIQMPLTITMEGRYRELVGLLDQVRRGNRAIRINDIVITLLHRETAVIRVVLAASSFHVVSD